MTQYWTAVSLCVLAGTLAISAAKNGNNQSLDSNSNLTVLQIAGKNLFMRKECVHCHTLSPATEGRLTPVTDKRHMDWFEEHVQEKSPIVLRQEKSKRKQRSVLKAEIAALDAFLFDSSYQDKSQIDSMDRNVFDGAYLLYQNNCLNCHIIAGVGKDLGPDLTRVGNKRDKDWLLGNLDNPQQFAADSEMPKFDHLSAQAKNQIIQYMLTLR